MGASVASSGGSSGSLRNMQCSSRRTGLHVDALDQMLMDDESQLSQQQAHQHAISSSEQSAPAPSARDGLPVAAQYALFARDDDSR
jgi:hypothetical protein